MISQAKAKCFKATRDYQNTLFELKKILNEDSDPEFWYEDTQLSHKAGRDDELKRTLPHILPLWDFESIQNNLISCYFNKKKDQDGLKKTLPKDGIYCMSKEEANRFLLASLISYLEKPERITTRINAFLLRREATPETLWQVIAGTDLTAWKSYPPEHRLHPNAIRHEMVHRMAVFLEKYNGDARGLWSGVTRGEVLMRLEDIGFQDTVNDFIIRTIEESHEISVKLDKKWSDDRHLNRITARLILGEDTLSDHPDIVYARNTRMMTARRKSQGGSE